MISLQLCFSLVIPSYGIKLVFFSFLFYELQNILQTCDLLLDSSMKEIKHISIAPLVLIGTSQLVNF